MNKQKWTLHAYWLKINVLWFLNETFNVDINREVFRINVVENSRGPLRIYIPSNSETVLNSSESQDFLDEWVGEEAESPDVDEEGNVVFLDNM